MNEHCLRSQVRMGSESDCLFGQLDRISWTSDSEAGVKTVLQIYPTYTTFRPTFLRMRNYLTKS